MFIAILTVCCLSLVSQIQGQLAGRGPCPSVKPMTDLDSERINGIWYTRKRIDNNDENGHTCSKLIFTSNPNGTVSIEFNGVIQPAGTTYDWQGLAMPAEQPSFGFYRLTYPSYSAESEIPIIVLGTDYDHYAAVYSCDMLDGAHYQYAWNFGRSRTTDAKLNEAESIWESNNISPGAFTVVDQTNCPN